MIRLRALWRKERRDNRVLMKSTIFGYIALYDDVGIRINILLRKLYLMS